MGNLRIIKGEPEKNAESLLVALRRIAEENKRERISSLMLKFLDAEDAQASTGETGDLGIHDWHKQLLSVLNNLESDESDTSTTEATELPLERREWNAKDGERIGLFREKLERELSQFDPKMLTLDPELHRYLQGVAWGVGALMFTNEDVWEQSSQRIYKMADFMRENDMSDPEADRIQLCDTIEEIRTLALSLDQEKQKKIQAMLVTSIAEGFEENDEAIPPEIRLQIASAGQQYIGIIRSTKESLDDEVMSPALLERMDEGKKKVIAASVGDTEGLHPRMADRRRATAEARMASVVRALDEDFNTPQKPLYQKLRSIFTLDELVVAIFGNIQNLRNLTSQ